MNTDNHLLAKKGVMSEFELARLGDGEVAYIKLLQPGEVDDLFPGLDGIPAGINLYALTGADGTPLELTVLIEQVETALQTAAQHQIRIAVIVEICEGGAGRTAFNIKTEAGRRFHKRAVSPVEEEQILSPSHQDVEIVPAVAVDIDDRQGRMNVDGVWEKTTVLVARRQGSRFVCEIIFHENLAVP